MSGLESAIRSALERADRSNAEIRARIYQSARQALEAGLSKQNINDPETMAEQRHRLERTIHAIEQEERARLKAAASVEPPRPEPALRPASSPQEPARTADDGALSFGADRAAPSATSAPVADLDDVRAERDDPRLDESEDFTAEPEVEPRRKPTLRAEPVARPRRRRGFFSRLFILVTALTFVGIAAWWIYSTGLLLSADERDGGLPDPVPTVSDQDAGATEEPKTIDPQRGFSNDWAEVFKPADIRLISARPNATVDVVGASDGQAVRITSRSADQDGAAVIQLPADVIGQMAGKTSTLALTIQAAGEKPLQFSVTCAFGAEQGCSRHRFTANPEKADLLFRVTLPQTLASGTQGQLFINADMNGQGQGVNLYSVRILPGN
ncbi:hypothetical protein [Rhizobium paknamense]|uniref:Biotin transporter BioY n=1 Tax=Rhizobium paknamense TaxID=1206817 RepID=A0ABU0ICW3_9HYPH|nr:hypothetical protein [Rhizobium paknamense]MDQ0455270.1 hypothetical protein [Rhizobium paknamense]